MRLEEIAAGWTPPDGLGYSTLRPVRLARFGYVLGALAAVFAIGGLVLGAVLSNVATRENAARERLERQGVTAGATIVRVWRVPGKDSEDWVSYRFEAGGTPLAGRCTVPRNIWRTLKAGDSLPVLYVPGELGLNHPAAWRMNATPQWVPWMVPAVFLFMAAMFVILIRREWRLLMEGRPAPGVVTKVRRGDKQVVVVYEFRLLSGAVQRGRGKANLRRAPSEGDPLCVLYDSENPRRSAIYPLQFVRLEGMVPAARRYPIGS